MKIQLFEPIFHVDECLAEIKECLEKGWTGMGYKTAEFEKTWMEYMGVPNALFLNSCTATLNLVFHAMKMEYEWEDDAEIITTPNTFVSTNHAILQAGLVPRFADIDDTLCISPESVEQRITEKTKAVVFVGIGGNAGHYDQIVEICREYGLRLILDAAHMSGTRLHGEYVGKEADAICYSFHAVKNLPTADSGMLCLKDSKLAIMARKLSWLGINKDTYQRTQGDRGYQWQYDVEYVGNKYNGNSIMAAIALAQLPYLEEDNKRRRQIAKLYRSSLQEYSKEIQFVHIPEECESSCHLFQILVDDRDRMLEYLQEAGIFPGVHYLSNTYYSMYADQAQNCPYAEYVSRKVLSLPMHLRLTDEQIIYISGKIIDFINHRGI